MSTFPELRSVVALLRDTSLEELRVTPEAAARALGALDVMEALRFPCPRVLATDEDTVTFTWTEGLVRMFFTVGVQYEDVLVGGVEID